MSKLTGNEVALEVNTGTALVPVWKTAVCVTTNGLTSSSDDIDASSKCGAEIIPGLLTWTASFEGFAEKAPTTGQISLAIVIGYAMDQTVRSWRMVSADETYYRGFDAILSNYAEQLDYNTVVTFSADLNIVSGTLVTEAPAP